MRTAAILMIVFVASWWLYLALGYAGEPSAPPPADEGPAYAAGHAFGARHTIPMFLAILTTSAVALAWALWAHRRR